MFMFKFFMMSTFSYMIFLSMFFYTNINVAISMKTTDFNNFLNLELDLKSYSCWFLLTVAMITAMIFLYSYYYLGVAIKNANFSWVLFFFVMAMLFLISSESLACYLLGWDGLGVSSFLLILFYKNLMSVRSALATFITNRLGDMFIIMSFIMVISKGFLSTSYNEMMNQNFELMTMVGVVMMIIGASTKSAQIPFSAWLPAAMAAPTPVSALVHSSTLVTAGIYLLAKFSSNMDYMHNTLLMLMSFLTITLSLLSGMMAFFETDFKKMVAMSTLSQLGLLGYILFTKNSYVCMFHIFSHASFKSLLFLVVGLLIFCNIGAQDTRMISMPKSMTMTPMILFIATSMSLFGFLFTPGFFSKDMIITYFSSQGINAVMYILMIIACLNTVIYTIKSFCCIFNNFEISETYVQSNFSAMFYVPATILYFIMLMFGMVFFNIMFEADSLILVAMNKIMGVMVILLGMEIIRVSCAPMLQKISKPTTKNNKDLNEYFLQMANMNWLSNGLLTKAYKMVFSLKMKDNLELNFISENFAMTVSESNSKNLLKIKASHTITESFFIFAAMLILVVLLNMF